MAGVLAWSAYQLHGAADLYPTLPTVARPTSGGVAIARPVNNPLGPWWEACMLSGVVNGLADLTSNSYGYHGTPSENGALAINVVYNIASCGGGGGSSGGGGAGGGNNNLLAKLKQAGVKHNPQDIVRITELSNGRIVFLEKGNATSGLQHILTAHGGDFSKRGIPMEQIPDLIMGAIVQNRIVGYQGSGTGRPIFEVVFNGKKQLVAITVGSNGYIVGANPASLK